MTGMFHTNKNLHPDLIQQLTQLCSDPKERTGTWVHNLKAWPEFFDAVADGRKTFEVRRNDRGYREGDIKRYSDMSRSVAASRWMKAVGQSI